MENNEKTEMIERLKQGAGKQEEASFTESENEALKKSKDFAEKARKLIEDKKGIDVVLLDISKLSSFADYFVIATAGNIRQLITLKEELEKGLADESTGSEYLRGTEGKAESGWLLIDAGDVIINLFLEAEREKYQLEKIWRDAGKE